MALPKLTTPIYELTLPSTGKKISYRPFLVKEEKILLMAADSQDEGEIKRSILQIVRNCVIDEDFKPEQAPTFDVEYILIHLRIKSVNEEIKNTYTCNNALPDGKRCGASFDVAINLDELTTIKNEELSSVIQIAPDTSIKMAYPKFADAKNKSSESFDYDLIINAMETLTHKKKVYVIKDEPREETVEFLDSLTKEQFLKIGEFFDKLPRFEIRKEAECPKCGFKHNIVIEDLVSFF